MEIMFLRRTLLQIVIFTVLLVLSCGGEDTSSPFWHEKSDAARQINVYLSGETGVSWSTGGPTSTPVPCFSEEHLKRGRRLLF